MSQPLTCVAAVQMVSGRDLKSNLDQARGLLEQAKREGAEVVLLPENFAIFGSSDWPAQGGKEMTAKGPVRAFLSSEAARLKLYLIGGTLPTQAASTFGQRPNKGRVFTSCFVFGPSGEELGRYDKVHLFDVEVGDAQGCYRESDDFAAGQEPVIASLPQFEVGLSICYDLRFPELHRRLVDLGATVLAVPAAFTYTTGEAHWQVLLRARAIENQCYVLAANQGGKHSTKRETWGRSCIISPWGEVLAECKQGAGVVTANLDLDKLRTLRESMPVLTHRRF